MLTSGKRYTPLQSVIGVILVVFACSALWLAAGAAGGRVIESSYFLGPLVEYCGLPRGVATWLVLQRDWEPDRMPMADSFPMQVYRQFCDETLHPPPTPEFPVLLHKELPPDCVLKDVVAAPRSTIGGDEARTVVLRYGCAKRSLDFYQGVAGVDLVTEEERFDQARGGQALATESVRLGGAPATLRVRNADAKWYDLAWDEGGTHVELSAFGFTKDEVVAIAESLQ